MPQPWANSVAKQMTRRQPREYDSGTALTCPRPLDASEGGRGERAEGLRESEGSSLRPLALPTGLCPCATGLVCPCATGP
eukprot:1778952-Rhodomonas_salina.2